MSLVLLALSISFLITWAVIPVVIRVAELKHLFDEPDQDRKKHIRKTPTLGGVAIFAGLILAFSTLRDFQNLIDVKYLIPSLIIIFFAGIKDDILVLTPLKKLLAQFASAFLIVVLGNIKINSFYGMLGIQEIPYLFSVIFTIMAIIAIINCYNLIDGVDGLAGSLGCMAAFCFGIWFYLTGHWSMTLLSFSLAGSLLGFLIYNWQPAKIFMGDTGAMLVGFILAVLAIHFIELNKNMAVGDLYWIHASPSVAMGIMAIPIFDMLRVFFLRVVRKGSPFQSDRNHLHHLILDAGYSHRAVSLILLLWNLAIAVLCFTFKDIKSSYMLLLILAAVLIPMSLLSYGRSKKANT